MSEMIDESRGMTPTRRKFIHDHRKKADSYGQSLPFEIGKPVKPKAYNVPAECPECGRVAWVTKRCRMVICSKCSNLYDVEDK
jgi:predicted RNA-binding Zn-ribbon protein involved in translation (DUF1610 family)